MAHDLDNLRIDRDTGIEIQFDGFHAL